jgi:hypothetical protein
LAGLCSSDIPFGMAGRGSRGQPAAALGGARALRPPSLRRATLTRGALLWVQGLELLVAVLLARSRQPPPTVAAGGPHAELAAELITLPSGLLAMVCEAIVKLKARLRGCVRACVFAAWAIGEGPTRSRRVRIACQSRVRCSTHVEG